MSMQDSKDSAAKSSPFRDPTLVPHEVTTGFEKKCDALTPAGMPASPALNKQPSALSLEIRQLSLKEGIADVVGSPRSGGQLLGSTSQAALSPVHGDTTDCSSDGGGVLSNGPEASSASEGRTGRKGQAPGSGSKEKKSSGKKPPRPDSALSATMEEILQRKLADVPTGEAAGCRSTDDDEEEVAAGTPDADGFVLKEKRKRTRRRTRSRRTSLDVVGSAPVSVVGTPPDGRASRAGAWEHIAATRMSGSDLHPGKGGNRHHRNLGKAKDLAHTPGSCPNTPPKHGDGAHWEHFSGRRGSAGGAKVSGDGRGGGEKGGDKGGGDKGSGDKGGGGGEKGGGDKEKTKKQTKKDYASWAAATPEYRSMSAAKYGGSESESGQGSRFTATPVGSPGGMGSSAKPILSSSPGGRGSRGAGLPIGSPSLLSSSPLRNLGMSRIGVGHGAGAGHEHLVHMAKGPGGGGFAGRGKPMAPPPGA